MNRHDWSMVALIGMSAFIGGGVTAALFHYGGEVDPFEAEVEGPRAKVEIRMLGDESRVYYHRTPSFRWVPVSEAPGAHRSESTEPTVGNMPIKGEVRMLILKEHAILLDSKRLKRRKQ